MSEPSAEDPLESLRVALGKIEQASRVVIAHPDNEVRVRRAIAGAPFPGLLDVKFSSECPRDQVFLIPRRITTEAGA